MATFLEMCIQAAKDTAALEAKRLAEVRAAAELAARPKPQWLLPLDVRRTLHEIGLTDIRQSGLSTGRACPADLKWSVSLAQPVPEMKSAHAFLGSVVHSALADLQGCTSDGQFKEYWMGLINFQRSLEPLVGYRGAVATERDYDTWASRMVLPTTFCREGITVRDLVMRIAEWLTSLSIRVVSQETKLRYVDGDEYPITFSGTADVYGMHPVGGIVLDLKNYGLLGPILDEEENVKGQQIDSAMLTYDPQFLHYGWLGARSHGWKVAAFGLILPSNLIPLQSAGKTRAKGELRGPPVVLEFLGHPAEHYRAYQRDLVDTLTGWARGGFYRARPRDLFGKLRCPKCVWKDDCLKPEVVNIVGSAQALAALSMNHNSTNHKTPKQEK